MKNNRMGKAVLLGGLYTSQMLALAFIVSALPAILRQSGVGLDKIQWVFGLGLIWSLKFLWAPLVDRFGSSLHGHYRSWILVLQPLVAVLMILASFFPIQEHFQLISVLFVLVALLSATQDVAVDALAVNLLSSEERGIGNSIQAGGNLLGVMLGGGFVMIFYDVLGWQGSMLALAAGTAVPLVFLAGFQEPGIWTSQRHAPPGFANLFQFFLRPGIWSWVMILVTFRLANMTVYGLLNPLLVDLGWSLDRIGIAINILGAIFGMGGAFFGGWIITMKTRKSAMAAALILTALAAGGLMLPVAGMGHNLVIPGAVGLIMTAYGASASVMYTTIMDKSCPASAGTDFSLQMTLSNIPAFIAGGLGLKLAHSFGFTAILQGCIFLALGTMVLVLSYTRFETNGPQRRHV